MGWPSRWDIYTNYWGRFRIADKSFFLGIEEEYLVGVRLCEYSLQLNLRMRLRTSWP